MKLEPRERRPYVDYLVANRDALQLGKVFLGWGKSHTRRHRDRSKAPATKTAKPSPASTPKPAAKKKSSSKKAPPTPAKSATRTPAKAKKPASAPHPKPSTVARSTKVVRGVTDVKKATASAPKTQPKTAARAVPRRRRVTVTSVPLDPVPTPPLGRPSDGQTHSAPPLFENATGMPHIVPTFRFLNGDKVRFAVPLSATVRELRNRMRDFMLDLLAVEGHKVPPETVWVMLIVQGADLRTDIQLISETGLSNTSIVHCLITPYTQGEPL